VLLFGGSEGGNVGTFEASVLAAQGIPTLAVAYFGEPGLPSTLANIPLEYFQKALKVLAAEPGVDPSRMYVWGISRGSEAALLLGVHYPNLVHGVVAGVPSALVFGDYPDTQQPAWTLGGAAVPFVPGDDMATTELSKYPDAVIPVEKIKGPIFTVCGGADGVWPSCTYAAAITQRLAAHHSPYPHTALTYPDAGHVVGDMLGYLSLTTNGGDGGTVAANGAALADSHTKLLAFLKTT
jgi:dienelactone hydrolase